jgi:hypothetical protein
MMHYESIMWLFNIQNIISKNKKMNETVEQHSDKLKVKRITTVSIILFIVSLTLTAINYEDYDKLKSYSSISIFLLGGISILGGGLFEWLIWLANPIYFIALLLLLKRKRLSIIFSILATLIACSFATWHELLVSESGRMAKIESLGMGYVFWLLSFMILTYASFYNYKSNKSVQDIMK